jgi:ribonuclease HI
MKGTVRVNFDGACWNKEGHWHLMGVGVAVFINEVYEEDLSRAYGVVQSNGTNNIAEWIGCCKAAEIIKDLKKTYTDAEYRYKVCGDSQIIVNQFNGSYAMNQEVFRMYRKEALSFNSIKEVTWVPREQNKEADKLSKQGLDSVKPNEDR